MPISPTTAWPNLDIVIASVHSAFSQDESQMTGRILAIECPRMSPTSSAIQHGRRILSRGGVIGPGT